MTEKRKKAGRAAVREDRIPEGPMEKVSRQGPPGLKVGSGHARGLQERDTAYPSKDRWGWKGLHQAEGPGVPR